MGKREKKQKHQHRGSRRGVAASYYAEGGEGGDYGYNDITYNPSSCTADGEDREEGEEQRDFEGDAEEEEENQGNDSSASMELPSKFLLYQQSVQSPKGDISYLQKFFLMYVGGRQPLHLQEDFCGTALLSTAWLRSDPRRTAIGLDIDLEALNWCMDNNITRIGADGYSRISLLHGNVLTPRDAKPLKSEHQELISRISLDENDNRLMNKDSAFPARDIVCAFNFSCCCLHKRTDLLLYFKHVLNALSKKGGIFVIDLYGGTSAEQKLRLQRKFPNFKYIWEQDEFDIIERKTRISLHYNLLKQKKKIRNAFSYSWRLWSLPEIKDCLEEAGFRSVHFWLREMPDTRETRSTEGFGSGRDRKYEEVRNFQQCDAWNAYIVAVAK